MYYHKVIDFIDVALVLNNICGLYKGERGYVYYNFRSTIKILISSSGVDEFEIKIIKSVKLISN